MCRGGSDWVNADADNGVKRWRTLERGEPLFQAGGPSHSVSVICAGSSKTIVSYKNGQSQVTGFHIAGELVGAWALGTQQYPCTGIALQRTTLCELPVSRLEYPGDEDALLQHDLFVLLGQQIVWDYQLLLTTLGKKNAAQRIAAFIVNIWRRYAARGMDGSGFPLPMSRNDIASYLGLSTPTVQRVLAGFEQRGLITPGRKYLTLRMPEELVDIADLPPIPVGAPYGHNHRL
jgi:CRP/FNR family transcriptional regulator